MASTRDLTGLPDIDALKALSQAIAVLDAILCPEWEYRYYSFDARWDVTAGESMASMRDGEGDSYFCLFSGAGAILKGFDHESPMSPYAQNPHTVWPGVLDEVPVVFANFLSEPAFTMQDTTFCIWREYGDSSWHTGTIAYPAGQDADGSEDLLPLLDGQVQSYRIWAEGYYGATVNSEAIGSVYRHEPLTPALCAALNPERSFEEVAQELEQIGYPVGA